MGRKDGPGRKGMKERGRETSERRVIRFRDASWRAASAAHRRRNVQSQPPTRFTPPRRIGAEQNARMRQPGRTLAGKLIVRFGGSFLRPGENAHRLPEELRRRLLTLSGLFHHSAVCGAQLWPV